MEIGRVQVLDCEMRAEAAKPGALPKPTEDVYYCQRKVIASGDFVRYITQEPQKWKESKVKKAIESMKTRGIFMDDFSKFTKRIYISENNPFYNAPMLWSRFRANRDFREIGQLVYNEAKQ